MYTEVERIERRMAFLTYLSCFIGAWIFHMVGSILMLAWQTSCAWPPCSDSAWFDVLRFAARLPLLVTPWMMMPSPDEVFVRDWALLGLLILNSVVAVLMYWVVFLWARFGFNRLRAWRAGRAAT